MAFEHYIRSGKKLLRCGFTTGTCAALASQGAIRLLLTGKAPEYVDILTPKGIKVEVKPEFCLISDDNAAICGIKKDAGDDSDVTDGMVIAAAVRLTDTGCITVDGGEGVGRVTKPGLDQPVGAAAINHVPREMIEAAVRKVCEENGYTGGVDIIISVPDGEKAAKKTFNPRMGVEGGISIIGTSGIVEPMSEQALIDTIELELRQNRELGHSSIILTPGNYGMDFISEKGWNDLGVPVVRCSNFVGDTLDICSRLDYREILLVGHAGKLVKLAGGVMNTHSRYADCRTELFCAHAAVYGGDRETCVQLMSCATTDACIDVLDNAGIRDTVIRSLMTAIQDHIARRIGDMCAAGAVMFSNQYGLLDLTETARKLLDKWKDKVV